MITRSKQEWIDALSAAEGVVNPSSAADMYDQGHSLVALFRQWDIIRDGDRILDLGCGVGRLAMPLTTLPVTYLGLDILPFCIAFCHKTFRPWREFGFRFLDAVNPYYLSFGGKQAEDVVFPVRDGSYDVVLAISLFTHLERETACRQYLKEVERVLKPGGRFLSTWFRSPPHQPSASADRTVFLENDIRRLLARFRMTHEWGGQTDGLHDQWIIAAETRPY